MTALDPMDIRRMLVQVTRDAWSTFLDARAEPMPTVVRQLRDYRLESLVHFDGPWSGSLSLVSGPGVASRWASTMFGVEAGECCDEDVLDAAGELANVIAGGVKPLLPPGTKLTPPQVRMSQERHRGPSRAVISAVEFGESPKNFVVALLEPATERVTKAYRFNAMGQ